VYLNWSNCYEHVGLGLVPNAAVGVLLLLLLLLLLHAGPQQVRPGLPRTRNQEHGHHGAAAQEEARSSEGWCVGNVDTSYGMSTGRSMVVRVYRRKHVAACWIVLCCQSLSTWHVNCSNAVSVVGQFQYYIRITNHEVLGHAASGLGQEAGQQHEYSL
jgi:hypothetical protein